MDRFRVFTHEVTLHAADVVYATDFGAGTLARDWAPESGTWSETDGGLRGSIAKERAAACWHRGAFPRDLALCFTASTEAPADRDINCYWSGAGSIYGAGDRDCYVGGLAGWWGPKHGIERYPEGGLLSLVPARPLTPGRRYDVLAGRLGGWQFLHLDGELVVETLDPRPIDAPHRDRIGLATWASTVVFHRLEVHALREVVRGRGLEPEA